MPIRGGGGGSGLEVWVSYARAGVDYSALPTSCIVYAVEIWGRARETSSSTETESHEGKSQGGRVSLHKGVPAGVPAGVPEGV